MLLGPVFAREAWAAPRRVRWYVGRSVYVLAMLVLLATAWLLVTGNQVVRNLGDVALFGTLVFQFLAIWQLAIAIGFAPLLSAGLVSQEKDRGTLDLLLLTRLTNSELVLGQLGAGLLQVVCWIAAAMPLFLAIALLGGVSFVQIARVFEVTIAATLLTGSAGVLVALWRAKTFQAIAFIVLGLALWIGAGELFSTDLARRKLGGLADPILIDTISPLRAMRAATAANLSASTFRTAHLHPAERFALFAGGLCIVFNAISIVRMRAWNMTAASRREDPSLEKDSIFGPEVAATPIAAPPPAMAETSTATTAPAAPNLPVPATSPAAPRSSAVEVVLAAARARQSPFMGPASEKPYRHVHGNPIYWREAATWAYGRRVILVRLVYALVMLAAAIGMYATSSIDGSLDRVHAALVSVPLLMLSLVIINALAVNAICSERDGRTLDLLLVTELTPREIVFGKLGGILFNTKEMVLLPLALCALLWFTRDFRGYTILTGEELTYVLIGLVVLIGFAATLGMHAGMTYANSRLAMAISLGTLLFLFLGVAACMRMIVAFAGSFQIQFFPFAAFILGGGVALFAALGSRNPSPAIGWTALLCPFATFYAITSFLLDLPHFVFIVVTLTYGFATAAMLVPAVSEFDVAIARATEREE